jgi:cytochrome c-type biogenesis protein CcmE
MKKGSVIALVVIAIAATIVVTSFGDASVYVTFDTAKKMVVEGNDQNVHVVGEWK